MQFHHRRRLRRPGAAERQQREIRRIDAALDGHLANGVRLIPVGDLDDAVRKLLGVHDCRAAVRERVKPPRARSTSSVMPPPISAGGNPAEHQIGVGDGRLVAAVRIAHRAGHRAGAARPDAELAFARDPGDRAAAGADGLDVEHRNAHRETPDPAAVGDFGLALSIRQRSVEVPPASSVTRSGKPATSAITALPSAPAAGPDSAVVIGLRMTWSGLATPPLDCITRNGFLFSASPSSSRMRSR